MDFDDFLDLVTIMSDRVGFTTILSYSRLSKVIMKS